jgi:hypothetical protein
MFFQQIEIKFVELLSVGLVVWKSCPETGWKCLLGYIRVYLYRTHTYGQEFRKAHEMDEEERKLRNRRESVDAYVTLISYWPPPLRFIDQDGCR